MENIVAVLIVLVFKVSIFVSGAWTLVEFLLYLFKDKAFNFASLYTFIVSCGLAIVLVIASALFVHKFERHEQSSLIKKIEDIKKDQAKRVQSRT